MKRLLNIDHFFRFDERVMSAHCIWKFTAINFAYETELYLRLVPNVRIQFYRDHCSYKQIRNNSCFSFDFNHDFGNSVIQIRKSELFRDNAILDIDFIWRLNYVEVW